MSQHIQIQAIGVLVCFAVSLCPAGEIIQATGVRGGLVVHVGCGDGKRTAALRGGKRYVVHGLDTDPANIAKAREHIRSLGLYGPVSVARFDGKRLPYRDNLVNLLVASDGSNVSADEILRVLAPLGVAYVSRGAKWTKTTKPWPKDIDEWTHYLHGPSNNAVARDRVVGPPRHLQWIADPMHLRSHEHLNSISALVSARGRIFYVIDDGPTSAVIAPPKWRLVARDAFSGILLWKRDIGPWEGHFRLFRSGPPDTPRRLVAVADRVYVTLGYNKQVAAFDAATGETVRTYDATKGALEIVCDQGRLFVVVGTIDAAAMAKTSKRFAPSPAPRRKGIVVLDAASGRLVWKRMDKDTAALMPTTLAVSDGRVFFQNTRQVICVEADSGKEKWRADRRVHTRRLSWSAPILVASGGVVLSADGSAGGIGRDADKGADRVEWIMSDRDIRKHPVGDLVAFNAATGKQLWTGKSLQGFCSPGDLFVIDGLVWAGANVASGQMGLDVAVDLRTGQIKSRRPDGRLPVGGHARCYRDKATERFLVLGGSGVEMVNVKDWSWNANHWVRGTCQYGVMPCNGLLYAPSDSCACRPEMRLHGFTAMAAATAGDAGASDLPTSPRLRRAGKSPAFAKAPAGRQISNLRGPAFAKGLTGAGPGDWPTYRGDAARSGRTKSAVPAQLKRVWRTEIGGKLTSLTAGVGKVFVSRFDTHTVFALDAGSGKIAWRRTVGGGVDSPPTVHRGRVIFGCRDGWVYCLRAADGEWVWRFRAAPRSRLLVAQEAVESAWPVHGSVLVRDGLVWLVAGRSPYLDGGIRLCVLEAATGKAVITKRLSAAAETANRTPPMLPDILSASGELVYMRWMGFDKQGRIVKAVQPHLFSATGFLDDTWWHRTYWQHGTWMRGGFGGWPQAARQRPAGRIMAVADDALFGFGRSKFDVGNPKDVHAGHIGLVKDGYQDIGRVDHSRNPYALFRSPRATSPRKRKGRSPVRYTWRTAVGMLVRGMVLADQTLFVAGPPAGRDNRGLTELDRAGPGLLWAVSAADGKKLSECELPSAPVFDGMAAVGGCLLISGRDGSVSCLGAAKP